MSLNEIRHLDPDGRWSRLQLNRDRELVTARLGAITAAILVVASAALAIALRIRRR